MNGGGCNAGISQDSQTWKDYFSKTVDTDLGFRSPRVVETCRGFPCLRSAKRIPSVEPPAIPPCGTTLGHTKIVRHQEVMCDPMKGAPPWTPCAVVSAKSHLTSRCRLQPTLGFPARDAVQLRGSSKRPLPARSRPEPRCA